MIQLRRGKTQITCSSTLWTMSIEMARLCGWVPAGTTLGKAVEGPANGLEDLSHLLSWQTDYVCQDGQTVSAKDAAELADSLVRAGVEGKAVLDDWNQGRIEPTMTLRTPSTGFIWFFSDEGKNHLRQLADFCRAGAFQIY